MTTTRIVKGMANLRAASEIRGTPEVFVENASPPPVAVCGKLEYLQQDGTATIYREVAAGCVWVYLTDCNGTIDAGMQHQCVPGNQLRVEGCHSFGCQC